MPVIPQATIEQIRNASDIVDVIGSYLPLKRAGTNFIGLCPFHNEKTPSFNVSPSRQIFHCFGCHKGGDVFTFLREFENLTFVESVQRLAERARIPIEFEMNSGQREEGSLREKLRTLHEQVARRWETTLANAANVQAARDYLAKRGISDEAVKRFRIGFAPDEWDDTVNWAKSKKHDTGLLEKGGLAIAGDKGHYDRFRGRLIFPICDEQGRVIGFSGRVLSAEQKGGKYINSPETPIFSKRRVIYGLDKATRPDDLLASGLAIRVAVIPQPHDPDSFIREKGADTFRQLIADAPGFFDFLLDYLCRVHDASSDRGRINIVQEMRDAVQKTASPVLIDTYAQKVSRRLDVDTDAVRAEFKKKKRGFRQPEPEYDPAVREILQQHFALAAGNPGAGMPALLSALNADAFKRLATEAVADGRTIPDPAKQLKDIVLRLRNQFIERRLGGIKRELTGANDDQLAKLLAERTQLKELTRHPLAPLAGS